MQKDGILVGCDQNQEWLLPWWWDNYRLHNNYPVAFCDFGLTDAALKWCQDKGEVISVKEGITVAKKESLKTDQINAWQTLYSDTVWRSREAWFKKPLACLQSPFDRSIWIDADCEVRDSLEQLFDYCDLPSGIALAKVGEWFTDQELKRGQLMPEEVFYNSGVVVFRKNNSIIAKWAKKSCEHNSSFSGDQSTLSRVIFEEKIEVAVLPDIYNWPIIDGANLQAIILHWDGPWGKSYLKEHGGLREALKRSLFSHLP